MLLFDSLTHRHVAGQEAVETFSEMCTTQFLFVWGNVLIGNP